VLHLVDKVLYAAVKAVLSVALALGVLLNPVFDDLITLNRQIASVRDDTLAALPGDLIGRPTEAPHVIGALGDETISTKVRFAFQDDVVTIPVKITPQDMRYDVDISSAWVGSNYERTRRVGLYVREYADSPMIGYIARRLRDEQRRHGLTRDEYADLIVTMVQRMPYDSPAGTQMRPPVRVMLDGAGDCDERALLAAAILVHEGYDAAIFEFDKEQHAALGLRTTAAEPFPGTSYAFVEMTEVLPIGEWSAVETLGGETALLSTPLVVPVSGAQHAAR